jgi:CheY-like chemotaxis protein
MRTVENEAPLHVLLVDDDHTDLALMGLAIERSGHNIWLQTAADAQRAIDYLAGKDIYADRTMHPLPDLILLDLDMPLSGGFDFLDWRKASAVFSSLPVAILSGSAYPGAIQTALSMGAIASFTKPDQFQNWNSLVEQVWTLVRKNYQQHPVNAAQDLPILPRDSTNPAPPDQDLRAGH